MRPQPRARRIPVQDLDAAGFEHLWRPHLAALATVAGTTALGIIAEHMAGALLAFVLTALLAKMQGEQIARAWP